MTADEAAGELLRFLLTEGLIIGLSGLALFLGLRSWWEDRRKPLTTARDYVEMDEDDGNDDEKPDGNAVPVRRERSRDDGNDDDTPHNDGVEWPERLTRAALVQMLASSGRYTPAEITAALLRPQVQADGFITDPTPENLLRWLAANTDFTADAMARMISMRRELALDIIRSVRQPESDEIKIDNGKRVIPRHVGRVRRAVKP
jgi:hypothetical protein